MSSAISMACASSDEANAKTLTTTALLIELDKAHQVINLLLLHATNLSAEDQNFMQTDFDECGLAPLLQERRDLQAKVLSAYSSNPKNHKN